MDSVGSLAACTLGDGTFHYGTGALANSLHTAGFRGLFYIGYRGELPQWAGGRDRVDLPGGMAVCFVRLDSDRNPNFEKARFMLDLLSQHPEHRGVAYFDSDVVVRAPWDFFEEWSTRGVGLCMDKIAIVPEGHPWRAAWRDLAHDLGLETRPLDFYCNGGFALVPREHAEFLELWRRAVDGVLSHLLEVGESHSIKFGDIEAPFHRSDQDALAIAMMATQVPLSVVGPDGMSFAPGSNLMSHAIHYPKPWQRQYVRDALRGVPPVHAHREYWKHTEAPIQVFGAGAAGRARSLRVATAVGSLYRRPRFWGAS